MNDPLAMVPIPATSPPLVMRCSAAPSAASGFFLSGLLAIALFLGGSPILAMCVLTASALSSFLVGPILAGGRGDRSRSLASPEDVASGELRSIYRSILLELADVERVLAEAPRLGSLMASALDQARGAVALSGRLALLGNPLQRYFDRHDRSFVSAELERLRERTAEATDQAAATAWKQAAAARARQLAIHDEMAAQRDRIHARLELVRASLERLSAMIAKLQILDEEQIVLASDSVTEQLEGLGEDLATLESVVAADATDAADAADAAA